MGAIACSLRPLVHKLRAAHIELPWDPMPDRGSWLPGGSICFLDLKIVIAPNED
jgi:hypothetical protein